MILMLQLLEMLIMDLILVHFDENLEFGGRLGPSNPDSRGRFS